MFDICIFKCNDYSDNIVSYNGLWKCNVMGFHALDSPDFPVSYSGYSTAE